MSTAFGALAIDHGHEGMDEVIAAASAAWGTARAGGPGAHRLGPARAAEALPATVA